MVFLILNQFTGAFRNASFKMEGIDAPRKLRHGNALLPVTGRRYILVPADDIALRIDDADR